MPDVPDQPVIRRIEDIVDCGRQFDYTQTSAQMTAGNGNGADHFRTQFVGKLPEVFGLQFAEIGGILDGIEQWCFGSV